MKKLTVNNDYRNEPRGLDYRAGQTIEVEDDLAAYLLADSPGSFAEPTPVAKQKRTRAATT